MKKVFQEPMILLMLLFLVFVGGILLGRHTSHSIPLAATGTASESPSKAKAESLGKLDINTASIQELTTLPGIGDTLAKRIVDYRTEHGPFEQITDLKKVEGVGIKLLQSIRDYITVK